MSLSSMLSWRVAVTRQSSDNANRFFVSFLASGNFPCFREVPRFQGFITECPGVLISNSVSWFEKVSWFPGMNCVLIGEVSWFQGFITERPGVLISNSVSWYEKVSRSPGANSVLIGEVSWFQGFITECPIIGMDSVRLVWCQGGIVSWLWFCPD